MIKVWFSCENVSNQFSVLKQVVRYGMVIVFNALMWGCYVNSLKALSSLQATVTNFATNFLSSGLAGFFLFEEALRYQVPKEMRGNCVSRFCSISSFVFRSLPV